MEISGSSPLRSVQNGAVSRRQLERLSARPADIERLLRRRDLVRVLPGVFLDHTGDPTWLQRAWAGVLYAEPAALTHASAIRAAAGPGWRGARENAPIQIAVAASRRLLDPPGCRIRRVRGFENRVLWNTSPPRVRLEDAVLDVAAEELDEMAVVGLLADPVQSRRTTARRVVGHLDSRPRLAHRSWIRAVLEDVAQGTCSVLEHRYLTDVERAHRLPRGKRQLPAVAGTGPIARDVVYRAFGLVVELDGRLFHDTAGQRDRDLERDLGACIDRLESVRLGWGQVVARPCATTVKLARLLQRLGWRGAPVPCGPTCTAGPLAA